MTLAERIKNARIDKRYTQKDLANLMNVKSTTVSGWELGRNEPSIETLKKLANKLDVSFSYLAGVEDDRDKLTSKITYEDLGLPYKGVVADDVNDMYRAIAETYAKQHNLPKRDE